MRGPIIGLGFALATLDALYGSGPMLPPNQTLTQTLAIVATFAALVTALRSAGAAAEVGAIRRGAVSVAWSSPGA